MDRPGNSGLLYTYASELRFDHFNELFNEIISGLSGQERADAYLMLAQIKLFAADDTLLDDLEKAEPANANPGFPCLIKKWQSDRPNRFVAFRKTPGKLRDFIRILPGAGKTFGRWFGNAGYSMALRMRSEIGYFTGRFDEAIALAEEHLLIDPENYTDAILSQCVLFRCYLATGEPEKAEQSMMDMIRLSKAYPECAESYKAIRIWANLTTGWSGDSPRFHNNPEGKIQPVLEDRLSAIQNGFSRESLLEVPFIKFLESKYGDTYTIREYYMLIFHALYWFYIGDSGKAESYFIEAYTIASATGLDMPFVEYGKQILPLLWFIKGADLPCSHKWLDAIASLAEQYEESINAYRT